MLKLKGKLVFFQYTVNAKDVTVTKKTPVRCLFLFFGSITIKIKNPPPLSSYGA